MLVLVVYDIPDDKCRDRLAKFLEGHGRRVQKSVFECFKSLKEMDCLYKAVQKMVDPAEDNVRFYWISEGAMSQVMTIGSALPEPPPDAIII